MNVAPPLTLGPRPLAAQLTELTAAKVSGHSGDMLPLLVWRMDLTGSQFLHIALFNINMKVDNAA